MEQLNWRRAILLLGSVLLRIFNAVNGDLHKGQRSFSNWSIHVLQKVWVQGKL
ncbi:MAG: hypothetical protein Hyperionvirus19_10 [Hyperionvirus sp.]|uniref:Uncharacterized protein n=1 Tax=Hyperionvirus sp. TaxID=2487770 RepID=A0A3G5AAB7_9VIRU|nr:MAG: hypothetical protein Hyperionvirus19_10 [Hyperionvirus sp.]